MEESVLQRKLAKLIQVELSTILQREAHLVNNTMVTISIVRVTRDLEMAKIYAMVFPDTQHEEVVKKLNKEVWEIRKMLAARIRNKVRKIPTLIFYKDDTLQEANQIDALIASLDIPEAEPEEETED